jgi:hypothetical protein
METQYHAQEDILEIQMPKKFQEWLESSMA